MATAKAAYFEREQEEMAEMEKSSCTLRKGEELYQSTSALNKRSMVLDEETFEEQFLRCHVCKDRFSSARMPKLLPCHHSFCVVCIAQLYAMEAQQRQNLAPPYRALPSAVTIHCPACRAGFITTDENLEKLPTDHRVVQLMDFVSHTERYTVTFCSKHHLQPLNFFCEPCIRPVCRDCTVLDHKETENHLVMDLEEALGKYTPVLDAAIREMESESETLEGKRIALDTAIKTMERQKEDILHQLHATFNRLRSALGEREKELEGIVVGGVDKEKSKMQDKSRELIERRQKLLTHASTLKAAKEESNVEEMFRVHQEVRDYRAGPPIKVREVDDGIMTTFALNVRDEALLLSRIANFGDFSSRVEATCPRIRTVRPFSYRSASTSGN